ncbi:Oxygen-independent coproporphyrinogen-III oxidase-like protein [Durusdinium trenchii]|uniref:Oxygen-independent coproporphyrinogen-III oxidase-like protein n=1 Tax=Durusdinium trenchii TaxID=1381693 RepID=A0ABP0KQ72_9DINO
MEFSRALVALFPWGAVGQACQAILNAKLVEVESNAATNEARIVKYGPKSTRNRNAIDASLIEFGRLQKEVFSPDSEIKKEILALRPGELKEFRIRSKEGRREVHLLAAELNMYSQSFTLGNQRVVSVKNTGQGNQDVLDEQSLPEFVQKEFLDPLKKELDFTLAEGVPEQWNSWVTTAGVAAATAQASPSILGPDASQVILPLVTGGIGLLTVWQERVGREQVAYAKKDAALLLRQHAEAESLVGLAALSAAALPTYVAVSAVASGFSCVGFLAEFGTMAWTFELPTIAVSMMAYILSLERQEQVEKYILGVTRIIGGKPPRRARPRAQLLWLALPVLVMLLPETLIRRCCAANALLVAEIGFVIANCARQVSFGEFYTARTRRVHSRTDAWAQIASACSRILPLTSALALSNTLVVTSLGAVNVSFGGLFPIFGLGVCVKAVQRAVESQEAAIITSKEGRDCQRLQGNFPPYPAKPEETFYQRPEDQVVRRVQDDLEELRVTVRGNDPNWIRVGSLVGILTGGSILAPFLLSELLTEVIVPLAGTVLTVFVVYAESDSRSCVAQAKTHAAQVNEQMSTMEELVSISSLWKAYLLGMVGVADCNAILGLVLKSPWNILKWHPHLVRLQEVSQLLVATASVILCGSAAGRLLQVREWAQGVEKIAADNFNQKMLNGIRQTSPKSVENGSGALPTSRRQRIFAIMAAALPPLLLLIFPLEAELAEKAVNSTGASALVVALTMMQAERASCKAERTQASCKRAASLCEAFANRAEQQGALLPFNSAVAIAIAGVITFLTELNPIAAAALTILQAMSWLVASRKGVATKFESLASLQVRSRFGSRFSLAGTAAKRGWFKPCEVLLKADSTRPGLPVAELPPDILRHLEAFKKLFAWGTVAPEPPVERLAAVGAAAAKKAASEAPEPLWRAVAHAHRGGNLKPEQRSKLKNLAFFPVFPSPPSLLDRADRLSAARLVAPRTGASQEESEEVKALIDAKWLVDVHSPDWPLRDVAEDILALVDVAPRPSHASVGAFVSFCSTAEPCFTEELRGALTHALASLAQEAKKLKLKPPQAMQQIIPHLKLYCKEGPGLGKGRFPARWLPAYAPGPNGVVPVLNDDNTKAAMLTPAQNLQLLGMLDHPKSRFPSAARLEAKDDAAIEALGILRLSDPRVKLQTRITGAAELVAGSVERIDVVLTLLWRSGGQELPADHMKVCLRKCDSIARELTLGHTNEKAACLEAFAIWGEQDVEKNRCDLLVAGDADDYAAEVEELFEARFETLFRSCETRPAKVLRLLRHLESDKDFNKFLARDFAGVLEQQELERRKAEARAALAAQLAKKQAQDQLEQQQRQQRAEQQAFAEALRQEEKARQAEMEEFVQAATAAKAQASSAELGMASAAKAPTPATPVLSLATQHLANAFTAGANSKDEAEEAKPQVMTVPAVPPMVVPAKAGLQPVGPLSRQQEPTPAGASSASSVVPAKAGLQPVGPLSRQQEPTPAGASSASSAPSAAQPGAVQPEVKRGGIYPLPNVAKPRVEPEAGPSASASAVPPRMSPASSEVEEPPTKKLKLSEAENNGDREDQPAENGQTDVTSDAKDATDLKVKEDDGHSALSSLQEELGKLRRENEALRTRAGQTATLFPVLGGHKEELDEKSELKTVATKGEIKRMKIEAKEVLYRPISEGFGFKMLQKMGWKEGEGLGKEEKGLATPLWVDPREGRSGLFSAQSGESRPPRSAEDEELPLAANPLRFVSEGGAVERISSNLRGLGFVSAQSSAGCGASMANGSPAGSSTGNMMHFQRATAPRPSVASVAPALFGLMADERWQNRSGGAAMLGELLAEALDPSAAERFLRLVDERLGPQVASHLSQTYGRPGQQDYVLQPLWQLTQHHVSTPYG